MSSGLPRKRISDSASMSTRQPSLLKNLLVSGDKAGTRLDLCAHYRCQHQKSATRRAKKRRRILGELGLSADPKNMNLIYSPLPPKPPKIQWVIGNGDIGSY